MICEFAFIYEFGGFFLIKLDFFIVYFFLIELKINIQRKVMLLNFIKFVDQFIGLND